MERRILLLKTTSQTSKHKNESNIEENLNEFLTEFVQECNIGKFFLVAKLLYNYFCPSVYQARGKTIFSPSNWDII